MKKKRILLLSEGFGVGHTQAAQALAVGLRQLSPNLQTRVMELGSFLHPTAAPLILSVYKKTVTSQPKLWGVMYRHQANKSLNRFAQLALHRLFYAQTAEIIRQLKPQAIVCTHPFPSAVISRLKRASGLDVPLFTVITDYDAHGTWVSSGVDQYFVSAAEVKDKLTLKGISPDKINVSGIPIHPRFWETQNKDELRSDFELKKMPTVMIMGGGWGLLGDTDLFRYIAEWRDRVQLLFCLGSNKKILEKLSSDPLFQH
ncbi:MAG: UDP-N-acetylglucosamine--LPS N-acetylglucosamine transferase, partial [Paenibacillus sp. RIFOXYA1_FULL_44_5]